MRTGTLKLCRPALAAALALLLNACGGGGGGGGAPAQPVPAPVTPVTPVTPAFPGAYADANSYSGAARASLAAPNEDAAVIAGHIQLAGQPFDYTATSGHLSASDGRGGAPAASFFYVAYTAPAGNGARRPLTFFYNGGPGSASLWLHLGSFGPRRLVSAIPSAVAPPVQLVDNQETLLAQSDLVFVDAIGTGYSQAIAPHVNQDFWGVDQDAAAFRDFVRRYLAVNGRQAAPLFLYGESYGAPRTAVLANLLETAGVRVSGVLLQSSILDYNSNCSVLNPGTVSCEGFVPSYAAIGAYYQRSTPLPGAADFAGYVQQARDFAAGAYRAAMTPFLAGASAPPAGVLAQLQNLSGVPVLTWQQDFDLGPDRFQNLVAPGLLVGRYDARVSAPPGSALAVDGDPSLTVINSAFVGSIRSYLDGELHYSARSSYLSNNDNIINVWNFNHDGKSLPDTIPDLAAALLQNPAMKVLSLNGYHDLATPFHQTELDLARLGANPAIAFKYYSGGHMTYLDDDARRLQQRDLIHFYNTVTASH